MESTTQSAAATPPDVQAVAAELYPQCGAADYGMSCDELARILVQVVRKYLEAGASLTVRDFCLSLKLQELVLARACAAGNERAWEVFLTRYREKLYDMGLHITREESAARELADSLYAELYGTATRDGVRVSKLNFYTGRGSIEGWLRTVMAQEHVNRYRR